MKRAEKTWSRHLFADADGRFPAKFNSWESQVLEKELADTNVVGWLRNFDRKAWSLTVPYDDGGIAKPLFPDFLILRKSKRGLVVDLLDPHLPDLADSAPKAVGLAKFAAKHGHKFGRIELIIVEDEQIRRLDLTKEATREKVRVITHSEQLKQLFQDA